LCRFPCLDDLRRSGIPVPAAHANLLRLLNNAIRPPAASARCNWMALRMYGRHFGRGLSMSLLIESSSAFQLLDVLGRQVGVFLDVGDAIFEPPRC